MGKLGSLKSLEKNLKEDLLGKNRFKYLFWSLSFLLGMFLAYFLKIEASPFTIMCGGVVAALLSYLNLETGKETKAKEIEEEIFKELEVVFYKYSAKAAEVVRFCLRNKKYFLVRKNLEMKRLERARLDNALAASEGLLEDIRKNKEYYESQNYDIDIDRALAHNKMLSEQLGNLSDDMREMEERYGEICETLEKVEVELSDSYSQYGDCYHDFQSLLEVFKSVHNRGGEKADALARKVYIYDKMIDDIYSSTTSPIKEEGKINIHPAKKSLLHSVTDIKSEVYRRIDQSSEFYIIKNRVILAAVVGTVFLAAGYNIVDGEKGETSKDGIVVISFE